MKMHPVTWRTHSLLRQYNWGTVLTSCLDRSSSREIDHFLLSLKMTSWISPQCWTSQARKYRWRQAQGKNAGRAECSVYCVPFLRNCLDEAPDIGIIILSIWIYGVDPSRPFTTLELVIYACLQIANAAYMRIINPLLWTLIGAK